MRQLWLDNRPFLNDHSAFDAYSVLVEADGRRLFYTRDICGHGRKAGIFEELFRKPPGDVDGLLMEGANIRAEDAPAVVGLSESDIDDRGLVSRSPDADRTFGYVRFSRHGPRVTIAGATGSGKECP